MIFEGNISVKSILEKNRRLIDELLLLDGKRSKDIGYIVALARKRNIPITYLTEEQFNNLGIGKTSGGVCLKAQTRTDFNCDHPSNLMCLLEGIEDPFNLGYCLRTLYSFGCTGVILPNRDLSKGEVQLLKSSAGAYEKMDIVFANDCANYCNQMKTNGYRIVAAYRNNATACTNYSWYQKTLLVIGGEMRGISSKVRNEVDDNVYIPYALDFKNALNAASATAVLAYSYYQQQGEGNDRIIK